MMELNIYNSLGQRVAKTSRLIQPMIIKEVMREWKLSFALVNNDNARQYIIPNVVFEIEGEKYDILRFENSSGEENITQAEAEHVSYRLNNYTIVEGYAKLGTIAEIIIDMLNSAECTEFTVGTCADKGTVTWQNTSTQPITLRAALFQMAVALGVEIDFNNFIINAPLRVGADRGKIFKFGKDLTTIKRIWDKTADDSTSYELDGAVLYRAGQEAEYFEVGDTVMVEDALLGYTASLRIVNYTKSLDTPLGDKITLASFYPNISDTNAGMKAALNTKIKEGQSYNNVSIDRIDGFKCIRNDNGTTVKMNAVDGFVVLNSDGEVVGGITADGYVSSTRLQSANDDTVYATIGLLEDDWSKGLTLKVLRGGVYEDAFIVSRNPYGKTTLRALNGLEITGIGLPNSIVVDETKSALISSNNDKFSCQEGYNYIQSSGFIRIWSSSSDNYFNFFYDKDNNSAEIEVANTSTGESSLFQITKDRVSVLRDGSEVWGV